MYAYRCKGESFTCACIVSTCASCVEVRTVSGSEGPMCDWVPQARTYTCGPGRAQVKELQPCGGRRDVGVSQVFAGRGLGGPLWGSSPLGAWRHESDIRGWWPQSALQSSELREYACGRHHTPRRNRILRFLAGPRPVEPKPDAGILGSSSEAVLRDCGNTSRFVGIS